MKIYRQIFKFSFKCSQTYKVGDLTNFDDTDTNGSGFRAQVSEIVGVGVSRIDTTITTSENAVFEIIYYTIWIFKDFKKLDIGLWN